MKLNSSKLKKIMANKELSVCELAKKASVSTASVSKYTRGLVEPSIKSIGKIANALNIDLEEIIEDEKSKHTSFGRHVFAPMEPINHRNFLFAL